MKHVPEGAGEARVSSRFSVRNAGAAENRREFVHDGTAHRADWARRKVLSEREHTRVVNADDNLRGLERANIDLESMTGRRGRDGQLSLNLYPKIVASFHCHNDVTDVTCDTR